MEKRNQSDTLAVSFIWRFLELAGSQGVNFVISIILARLLMPADYGRVATISVFISIIDVFITKGFGTALIQKKDADPIDFSTVFYFNIFFTAVLYIFIFVSAPAAAYFYKDKEMCALIRVLGIRVPLSGINSVQQAFLSKRMDFRKFFFATLCGTLLSALTGIAMAYQGYGVWAIVFQYLVNAFADTWMLWVLSGWRPGLAFSFERLKILFDYGWKLLCSGLLGSIYNNIQAIIIGKKYTSADLAFYNKGKQLPQTIISGISTAIEGVMFPAMANNQDTDDKVKSIARKSIAFSSYIMFPILMGIFAVGDSLIILLFTEKWEPCIWVLRLACIIYFFWPLETVHLQVVKALGRSDIFLKLEMIKKFLGIAGLITGIRWGVRGILIGEAVCSVLSVISDSIPSVWLISYSLKEQMHDIFQPLVLSVLMCICVLLSGYMLHLSVPLQLFIQTGIGFIVYGSASIVLQNPCYKYLMTLIKTYLSRGA